MKLPNRRLVTTTTQNVLPQNTADPATIDCLAALEYLHEPGIAAVLGERYEQNLIYTHTGSTVVAMNPFTTIEGMYSQATKERVMAAESLASEPHVYGLMETAFRNICQDGAKDQIFLVSGESGSGKTETTKIAMEYLCKSITTNRLQQDIQASNPIMEAFGNAATIRNHNSSRFGKFVKMQFDQGRELVGAHIEPYLLEKVRVTGPSACERNYNIFYQFLSGLDEPERRRAGVGVGETWRCMGGTEPTPKDAEAWKETKQALVAYGFDPAQLAELERLLLGILRLSNVEFEADDDGNARVTGVEALQRVADSLMVDVSAVRDALTYRTMRLRGEVLKRGMTPPGAEALRDTLQMDMYEALFHLIIERINQHICSPSSAHVIGILDIFGFETMRVNGFEQLCINYANERLQKLLNTHTFDRQAEEYEREGIELPAVEYDDNQPIIDVIGGKPRGILHLLSDECRMPGGSIRGMMNKFGKAHRSSTIATLVGHPEDNKLSIDHYAGTVEYDTSLFFERNMKRSNESLLTLMRLSSLIISDDLAKHMVARSDSSTVGGVFIDQLSSLVAMISESDQHFIRCIKPNEQQTPKTVSMTKLVEQLRAGGVVAAVKVARAGFPIRMAHIQFMKRYRMLCWGVPPNIEMVVGKLSCDVRVGRTKVFLTEKEYRPLESRRSERMRAAALVIQSVVRMLRYRRWYASQQVAVAEGEREEEREEVAMTLGGETARLHASVILQDMFRLEPIDRTALRIRPRAEKPKPRRFRLKNISRYRVEIGVLLASNATSIGAGLLIALIAL